MKQIDLREGARRQHRVVALFSVIQCWLLGLDGVAFQRRDLERLLGLDRFKGTRVKWLEEDLKEFFPHQQTYWISGKRNSLGAIFASRLSLDEWLPKGTMTTVARINAIRQGGPRIALFRIWPTPDAQQLHRAFEGLVPFFNDRANFDERFLAAYLSLLAQGQISPRKFPVLQEAT